MTWLVTGGAGYIGSHVVRAFMADGIPAVVVDDLSSGHRSFVRDDVPFYDGSVLHGSFSTRSSPHTRLLASSISPASSTPAFR